ncbi:PASTA domain-containing protein [Kitasatospora purpeofusca]|uniref:PASTA domain-containing protein n=1 Tax=Kitasatospora purpeofusca TaxID=67352 RepID=UPI0030F13F61
MALYCELCGTRTDGVERLGVYCPGEYCGTDLRAGADAGVRAWCEPERRFGVAGGTVLVDLLVCNSGPRATGFHLEPVEPVRGRLDFDRRSAGAPLASGATRRIELRYTVPLDLVGPALDIASRFGVPAADVVGQAQGALPSRFGVALRVAATSAHQGAACAAFAVDVPGQLGLDLDRDGGRGRDGGSRSGGSSGGDGRPSSPGRPATPGRAQRPGQPGQPDGGTGGRTGGGCGPLVIAVLVAVVAVLVAVFVVLDRGRDGGTSTAGPGGSDVSAQPVQPPPTSAVPATPPTSATGRPGSGGGNGGGNGNGGAGNGGGGGKVKSSPPVSPRSTSPSTSPPVSPTRSPTPRTVVLPPLAGLDEATAEAKLKDLGLRSTAATATVGRLPALQVLATDPAAGTEVPAGATVVLRVSDGRAPVPAVAGLTRADAEQLLRDLHFTKVTVFSEQDGTKPLNQALRTDPPAGTVVPLDAPVTLWFAIRPVLR